MCCYWFYELGCSHCKALKYKNEANGLCCANGKVKLIPLDPPPEPLYSLVSGIGTDSIHFLTNIQQYNNCFQMTSFGATNVVRENFMPTFKIQGQIYHRAGSLLPVSDSDNKFLQIYFMGNSPQEIDLRCAHNNLVKRSIVEQLQTLFHQHNQLIILFKTALDLMPSDSSIHFSGAKRRNIINDTAISNEPFDFSSSVINSKFEEPPTDQLFNFSLSPSVKKGSGLYKDVIPHTQLVYYDDPNELVVRLNLLTSSQNAGNTGVNNEIISIIEELRERNIIV
ncbi:uncharacterized protein LOC126555410 [Aphis gossypii]|uniref:uncharacterized protein LOC126553181 n=1 Tax=Aphis gossypii TaxID=80765 RepID=UPI0021598BEC|nr:uncharacterized protein LOC126553181 [Aphis gossypii]XP_050066289.1 uncharacterized protein LOC126555410 [Aphis gossypii]